MTHERIESKILAEDLFKTSIGPEFIDTNYNHLRHIGFFHYLELARINLFSERGLSIQELMEQQGLIVPVVGIEGVRYRQELKEGDEVVIKTSVAPEAIRLVFDQRLDKGGQFAMGAKVTCALIDLNTGRPQRIPELIVNAFEPR